MGKITLKDFVYLFEPMNGAYINTYNDTWPDSYRNRCYHLATLFADSVKNRDNILDRTVSRVEYNIDADTVRRDENGYYRVSPLQVYLDK